MKILVPVNKLQDVDKVVRAGADELYCGVLPENWKRAYSNVVSSNRREWSSANLKSFDELAAIVAAAHGGGARVLLTLNALYTEAQYPLVFEQVAAAREAGVDALIVADVGLLLALRQRGTGMEIHLSTGGAVFNARAARFFESLGVSRITLPRHVQPVEAAALIRECPSLQFEAFVLNSGCKNIDGFCTFLHGTSEQRHGTVWKTLKKMNFDRFFLRCMHRLARYNDRFNFSLIGVDSPCLLKYGISVQPGKEKTAEQVRSVKDNLASYFSFASGIDPCGACRVLAFKKMGVTGLKIVGRNYSAAKKVADVAFLKGVIRMTGDNPSEKDFTAAVRARYREAYGMDCGRLCYFP